MGPRRLTRVPSVSDIVVDGFYLERSMANMYLPDFNCSIEWPKRCTIHWVGYDMGNTVRASLPIPVPILVVSVVSVSVETENRPPKDYLHSGPDPLAIADTP